MRFENLILVKVSSKYSVGLCVAYYYSQSKVVLDGQRLITEK